MTKLHTELMQGPDAVAADEIKKACLAEFDRWAKHASSQTAGISPSDSEAAAAYALQDVREQLDDYLGHSVMLVISALRLTGWPDDS